MNKTILITGGAIRIGKAICKKFHKEGFNILCHYNSSKKYADELSEELNSIRKDSCSIIQFDLNYINKYPIFIKKVKELQIHDKDTGSSEVQIAQLTGKIENLSKHIKKFKKDKHSSVGLLRAVNRRKKIIRLFKKE